VLLHQSRNAARRGEPVGNSVVRPDDLVMDHRELENALLLPGLGTEGPGTERELWVSAPIVCTRDKTMSR